LLAEYLEGGPDQEEPDREFVTADGEARFVFPDPANGKVGVVHSHRNEEVYNLPRGEVFDPGAVSPASGFQGAGQGMYGLSG
jgi:hypothetical protein